MHVAGNITDSLRFHPYCFCMSNFVEGTWRNRRSFTSRCEKTNTNARFEHHTSRHSRQLPVQLDENDKQNVKHPCSITSRYKSICTHVYIRLCKKWLTSTSAYTPLVDVDECFCPQKNSMVDCVIVLFPFLKCRCV